MNVQNTFNMVIAANLYSEDNYGLMCHAIEAAYCLEVLTKEEADMAHKEIKTYLKGYGSLAGALDNRGLPWDFESRLKIYKDWENKPSLEKLQ